MSKPFSMIHSDIWGPSKVNKITRARWFITFIDVTHAYVGSSYFRKNLMPSLPSNFSPNDQNPVSNPNTNSTQIMVVNTLTLSLGPTLRIMELFIKALVSESHNKMA